MSRRTIAVLVLCCAVAGSLTAQSVGTAGGKGKIERLLPSGDSDMLPFAPRYAWTYVEGSGAKQSTWIVLTEKQPPVEAWMAAKDRAEARRAWCEKEKTPFAALKLDAKSAVDLYFLCPANGGMNTQMLSTANGLDSIVVKFSVKDGRRLKGTLQTGDGSCPGPDGKDAYCTPTGSYTFDAPLTK